MESKRRWSQAWFDSALPLRQAVTLHAPGNQPTKGTTLKPIRARTRS